MHPSTKGRLKTIIGLTISAIGLVTVLSLVSKKDLNEKNGFNRQIPPNDITPEAVWPKDPAIWNIAGNKNDIFYLQGRDPSKLFKLDIQKTDLTIEHLAIPNDDRISSAFELLPDSPYTWIFAKNVPAIIRTSTDSTQMKYTLLAGIKFTRAVKITNDEFVIRGFDTSNKEFNQVLYKVDIGKGTIQKEKDLSLRLNDGGIATDGLLQFDSISNRLYFVHFYCNKILCIDKNLSKIYSAHTIDTLSAPQTEGGGVGQNTGEAVFTNTVPSRLVNNEVSIYNGSLFVNSKIKGDNEAKDAFRQNSAIDVYRLKDGSYAGSFYIPDYKGEKLRQFKVYSKGVLVLYKNYVATFSRESLQLSKLTQ